MEDLFYFSQSDIDLEDIANIAQESGYRVENVMYENDHILRTLRIYHDPQWYWEWSKLKEEEGDFDSFDPSERAIVTSYSPLSSFDIEHHVDSLSMLLPFLKQVLARYDGWVGYDSKDFEPIHTVDSLEELSHPYSTSSG